MSDMCSNILLEIIGLLLAYFLSGFVLWLGMSSAEFVVKGLKSFLNVYVQSKKKEP